MIIVTSDISQVSLFSSMPLSFALLVLARECAILQPFLKAYYFNSESVNAEMLSMCILSYEGMCILSYEEKSIQLCFYL